METQLVQQIPCLICGNNAAYKKIKFAVDIRGTTPTPPPSPYGFEFELAEVTIKLYDLFYSQPRTLLLLKGTPTLPIHCIQVEGSKIAFVARDVLSRRGRGRKGE